MPNPLVMVVFLIVFLAIVAVTSVQAWRRFHPSAVVRPEPEPNRGATTVPPYAKKDETAGTVVYRLLAFPEDWVNRRVETVQLLGPDTALRRVSIDFEIPETIHGLDVTRLLDVIPVTLMAKEPLRGFDIYDEDGRALPVAGAARGVALGRAALMEVAKEVLGEDLHPAVLADLHAIAGGDARLVTAHATRMTVAAAGKVPASRSSTPSWRQRIALMKNDVFEGLLWDLAESYLLVVDVKPTSGRRIFKLVFEHEVTPREDHAARWLAARMGWIPTRLEMTVPAASKARSYHCEIQAPPDLEIIRARLDPNVPGLAGDTEATAFSVAHLHTPRLPNEADPTVSVWLRSSSSRFLGPAVLTALLTSTILWAGRSRLPQLTGEVEAASTFLVLVPALLATYLAAPGEHEIASALRSGVRVTLAGSGACAIIAGALLVAHLPAHSLYFAWSVVTIASTFCLLFLSLAHFLPRRGEWAYHGGERRGLPL